MATKKSGKGKKSKKLERKVVGKTMTLREFAAKKK